MMLAFGVGAPAWLSLWVLELGQGKYDFLLLSSSFSLAPLVWTRSKSCPTLPRRMSLNVEHPGLRPSVRHSGRQ